MFTLDLSLNTEICTTALHVTVNHLFTTLNKEFLAEFIRIIFLWH